MNITQKRINCATHVLIEIYKYTSIVQAMKENFIHSDIDMWGNVDEETGEETPINEGEYLEMTNDLNQKSKMSDRLNILMKQSFQYIKTLFKEKGYNNKTIAKKLLAIIDIAHNSYVKDADEILFKKDGNPAINNSLLEEYLDERLENIKAVKKS